MFAFIGLVFRHLLALLVAVALLVCGVFVLLLGVALVFGEKPAQVEDGSVLVLDLDRRITDAPRRASGENLVGALTGGEDRRIDLGTLVETLDRAAKDPRIVAVYLRGSPRSGGFASTLPALREVREAIVRVREHKPVVAYAENPGQRDLILFGAASERTLDTLGEVEVKGLSETRIFLADAMERLGLKAETSAAGRYKSVVDMFMRDEMSPADREQVEVYLEGMWTEMLELVAAGSKLDAAALRERIGKRPTFTAEEALEAGLADRLGGEGDVLARLRELGRWDEGAKTFRQVSIDAYVAEGLTGGAAFLAASKPTVAVVYVEGEIAQGRGDSIATSSRIARQLRAARDDKEVRAVVVRVNSPGGGITASEEIRREVEALAREKPVVVSMGGYAASGGYWVSVDADEILADPATITGSIGVAKMMIRLDPFLRKHGVNFSTVETDTWADFPGVARDFTEVERKEFDRDTRRYYRLFLDRVASGREMPMEEVERIAEGRVWTGKDAHGLGLVDTLGGLRDAVRIAAERAGVGEDHVVRWGPKPDEMDAFIEGVLESLGDREPVARLLSSRQAPLPAPFAAFGEIARLLDDPDHAYARLPFEVPAW